MTVTTKKFLTDQLKLIMSLTDEQVSIYTRETMFKVVEDLSGGICWASSHKIDDTGALLTPQAFLKWSEHPDKTLTSVIGMKVKGGKSLTKEHFGGVRSDLSSSLHTIMISLSKIVLMILSTTS